MDLRGERERVIHGPAARRPLLLRDEQRRHQRLEHAAAPARDDSEVLVWVGPLEHVDAEIRLAEPTGWVSCQFQSQVSGNVRQAPKYSLAGISPLPIPT